MYGGFVPEQEYHSRRMPSVVADPSSPPPTPPKPLGKAASTTRLHNSRPDQEMQQPMTRLNQALPPVPPTSSSSSSSNLLPTSLTLRPPPTVLQAKPTRTFSYPILTHLPTQLPASVPEEHGGSHETDPVSPLFRHAGGASPILERDSVNSRFSMRRRASTSPSVVRRNSRNLNLEHPDAPLDDEAMRYAEEIRKKRESKRRWKEAEDEDRVIMGNKVDANHPNYITAYNMLTGLRVAVSQQLY